MGVRSDFGSFFFVGCVPGRGISAVGLTRPRSATALSSESGMWIVSPCFAISLQWILNADSILTVSSGSRPQDMRMFDVLWEGQTVVMFAEDVQARGEEITTKAASR
jgi:hypothetical protein